MTYTWLQSQIPRSAFIYLWAKATLLIWPNFHGLRWLYQGFDCKTKVWLNKIHSSRGVPQWLNKLSSDVLGHFTVKLNVLNLLMGISQCCGMMFQQWSTVCIAQGNFQFNWPNIFAKFCCSLISFGFHIFLFNMKQNHFHLKEGEKKCPTFACSSTD